MRREHADGLIAHTHLTPPPGANSPDVAVVDVEGEADDAEQDAEAGEDGHGCKQLLGQEAVHFDDHGAVSGGSGAWEEGARRRDGFWGLFLCLRALKTENTQR